ncbi:hypothetical protein F3Y22_tig00111506pilonHSYRG00113 [Hibiscus syriacus]|uniref:Nodulin-like domain-containing protein n=1 Tax=Hibiscus syriacus TaxID=106335 RepID=A0A6A2YHU7_HIBSY|nr:hypothetical protein F3Y22_tig00111506pilonHSYRG00113 [Hibiscus syriacus]
MDDSGGGYLDSSFHGDEFRFLRLFIGDEEVLGISQVQLNTWRWRRIWGRFSAGLLGCSICWFNTVCFVLCIKNFPANRALALSLTVSYNGVSAAFTHPYPSPTLGGSSFPRGGPQRLHYVPTIERAAVLTGFISSFSGQTHRIRIQQLVSFLGSYFSPDFSIMCSWCCLRSTLVSSYCSL